MKKLKKGFTIVELVIVVAVIAILAGVLIPVFSNVVKKANVSKDTQLVRNLNTALSSDLNEHNTMYDALQAAKEFGYDVGKINASATDNEILWDSVNDCFVYLNGNAKEYIPNSKTVENVADKDLWVISDTIDETFSTYYTGSADIDSTTQTSICVVTKNANLKIYAPNAEEVTHYNEEGGSVIIEEVAENSYYLFGKLDFLQIEKGHVVIEDNSVVETLHITDNEVDIDINAQATVNKTTKTENVTSAQISKADVTINIEDIVATNETGAKLFASGLGTSEKPYLIETVEQFENISKNYDSYAYYKVADGVELLDFETFTSAVNLNGEFDGNGATFANVSTALFDSRNAESVVVKNFVVECNIVKSGFAAAVFNYAAPSTTLIDVDVNGYIEGKLGVASYITFGSTFNEAVDTTYTFIDCESVASIVSTGQTGAGFVAHPYWGTGTNTIYIKDSKFTGTISSTDGTNKYLCVNACRVATVYMQYSEGYDVNGLFDTTTYKLGEANSDGWAIWGKANEQGSYCYGIYVKEGSSTKLNNFTGVNPEKGSTFTATAEANAVKAVAIFTVGPNKEDGAGNYTGAYITEELVKVDGAFTTSEIKFFDITINGSATTETGVSGNTFNIVNSGYGTTYHSASVTLIQYNAQGSVLSITTWNLK